jgi:hypothetical protein
MGFDLDLDLDLDFDLDLFGFVFGFWVAGGFRTPDIEPTAWVVGAG